MTAAGWTVGSGTAIGSSHERRGGRNEDAAGTRIVEGAAVLAVADGHSDPRCVRSATGARLAVRAALEVAGDDAEPSGLPERVVERWRELVALDRAASPDGEQGLLPYGTTLVAGRLEGARALLLQIGDGEVIAVAGDRAWRPMPPDGTEGTSASASLSADDAATTARLVVLTEPQLPALLLLATDGLDDAYPTGEALPLAGRQLLAELHDGGAGPLDDRLGGWVRQAAAVSGDDATVVVAVRSD